MDLRGEDGRVPGQTFGSPGLRTAAATTTTTGNLMPKAGGGDWVR
eukprot:COSAG04_NODE_342_length_16268_cov_11.873214_15_plen_45_part_00